MAICEFLPARVVVALMSFFGFQCLYLIRANISVLAVDMVKSSECHENNATEEVLGICQDQLDWTPSAKGFVLGSFFYGYASTQIIGGRLSEIYGSKLIFGSAVTIPAALTFLMPLCAKYHYGLAAALRIVQGIFQGVSFPSMNALITKWIPLVERSRYVGIIYLGSTFGLVITMPLCGYLSHTFSWENAFYVTAVIPLIWGVIWMVLIHNKPRDHPRISSRELEFIETSVSQSGTSLKKVDAPTPWKDICLSKPFLASIVCDMGNTYCLTMQVTQLPSFLKDRYQVNTLQNGFLSASPFLCRYLGSVTWSSLADYLIKSSKLSVTNTRKYFSVIAMVIPAIFMACVPFAETASTALVLFCLLNLANGAISASQLVNATDLAPNFSGTLFGISNTFASIASCFSPLIAGALLDDEGVASWNLVFWTCTPAYLLFEIIYFAYVSGEAQKWNYPKNSVNGKDEENISLNQ